LRRRRRKRRPVRGRPPDAADDRSHPGGRRPGRARPERLTRPATEQSMSTRSTQHYDVLIAGARCAGAATAPLLARQGARVLLLDRSRYGTDTLSTHALMRGAVVQLHRWGLLPGVAGAGTPPVRSATFHLADGVTLIPVKPKHGVGALYAPRRTVLDAVLANAARAAGAEVRFGVSVTGLRRGRGGRGTGGTGPAGEARPGARARPGLRRPRPPPPRP